MYEHFLTFPNFSPELFSIGPFQIGSYEIGPFAVRWYALSYIFGLLIGWWYARRLVANGKLWLRQPGTVIQLDDLLIWVTLGVVVGGRLGMLLYEPETYAANPIEILRVWHGGMAFHGGFLGATIAAILFAWRNKVPVLSYLDIMGAVAPIGLLLGRIANFINGELWGRETDVSWAMIFPHDPDQVPRHPSQLYEAATEGLALFILLFVMTRMGALKRPGLVAGVFGVGYAAARSFCEQYREPDGWAIDDLLTIGQAYSLPMLVAGLALIAYALMRKPQTA